MRKLLQHIVDGIVGENEATIEEEKEEAFTRFVIHVPKDKIGLVIGKGGRTISSIKNLLKVVAIRENLRVSLEVVEK